jgi:hypothetical protein
MPYIAFDLISHLCATALQNGLSQDYSLEYERPQYPDYTPADDPEMDMRNPRFTGSFS